MKKSKTKATTTRLELVLSTIVVRYVTRRGHKTPNRMSIGGKNINEKNK
jgi:hypothetical protein